MSLLLFKASKTFSYRTDLGVLASCKDTFRETVLRPDFGWQRSFYNIEAPDTGLLVPRQ